MNLIFTHKTRKSFGEVIIKCLSVYIELDFGVLVFCGGTKTGEIGETLPEQGRDQPIYDSGSRINIRPRATIGAWKASAQITKALLLSKMVQFSEIK